MVSDAELPAALLRMAASAAVPELTPRALAERFGPPSSWQPAPGQLWRAVWADTNVLLLLVEGPADAAFLGAPVTSEPTGEDEDSLVIDEERTVFRSPLTVWAGLARWLSTAVLDRPIEELGTDVVEWCKFRRQVPEHTREGEPLGQYDVLGRDVHAALDDDVRRLELARNWVEETSSAGPSTPSVVTEAQLDELQRRLGVDLPDVLGLVDGERAPTTAEAEVLEAVLGAVPVAGMLDSNLVIALSHPKWRPAARAWATRMGSDEVEARSDMARKIVLRSAARQTGDQTPAWDELIARWVVAHDLGDAVR